MPRAANMRRSGALASWNGPETAEVVLPDKLSAIEVGPPNPAEGWRKRFAELATKDRDEALCLAVVYYLSRRLPQKDIALLVGKSESLVSRAVAAAWQRGWLKYDISGIPAEYRDILPVFLNDTKLGDKVKKAFPELDRCLIVPGPGFFGESLGNSGPETAEAPGIPSLDQLVRAAAAERLKALFSESPCQTVVVAWGSTLNQVMCHLYELRPVIDPHNTNFASLKIYPLLGNFSLSREIDPATDASLSAEVKEQAFQISVKFSANTNARLLSLVLGQKIPPRPLLTVAILKASPAEIVQCKPVFESDQTLMALYGRFWDPKDKSGAIWETDTLITSVGVGRPEEQFYRALGYVTKGNCRLCGDIAGIIFDGRGRPVDLENRQLVGPRLEQIRYLARRHRQQAQAGPPPRGAGVLVVASGEQKVRPLTVLAKQGLINELITDEVTARGMLDLMGKE